MQIQPQLSRKCQYFFDRFANKANKRSPFPTDWELYFDFVHVCHDEGCPVTWQELYTIFIKAGFPQESAQPLSNFYKQGRLLLDRPEGYDRIEES